MSSYTEAQLEEMREIPTMSMKMGVVKMMMGLMRMVVLPVKSIDGVVG